MAVYAETCSSTKNYKQVCESERISARSNAEMVRDEKERFRTTAISAITWHYKRN
jgi:hypothetical protein